MYIIAGLGNPGIKYHKTRHNAGFDCIDRIAEIYGIHIGKDEMKALTGKGRIKDHDVLLVKPPTYMNNSGESLQALCNYYKVDPKSGLIVISDDVMLDPGRLRIRGKGSAGGHNGLKSIIKLCGTEEFYRVRIGVGKLPEHGDMINHVLGHLDKEERPHMEAVFDDAAEAIEMLMDQRLEEAMSKFNGIAR